MRYSAAARNRCFTNRHTSLRAGLRTYPVPPMGTTDAIRRKIWVAIPAPFLAWSSRMVRRCRLRNLPPFEKHAIKFGPRTFSGRVLCGTAQSPLFQAQSLLLRLGPRCLALPQFKRPVLGDPVNVAARV